MGDRRDFLRYASAAALAPLAAQGAISVIRVGILGTQHSHLSGKLKAMQNSPDYEVVSICEPDAGGRCEGPQQPALPESEMGEPGRIARRPIAASDRRGVPSVAGSRVGQQSDRGG